MTRKRTIALATAVTASCLLLAGIALADAKKSPATYTCEELIAVDTELQPQVVYWLDGYTWAGDAVVDEDVEWVPVDVEDVIVECTKDPSQPAKAVVKKHSKRK